MAKRRSLVINSVAMTADRLAQSIASFILTIVLVRYLGAFGQGQFALGYSYFLIFVAIFSQGFRLLFTRELAKETETPDTYLISGSAIQLVFAVVGYFCLLGLVILLPYEAETTLVCAIIGLSLLPFALSNVCESIFQAKEQMQLVAASRIPVYIVRLILIWVLLAGDYGIVEIAWVLFGSEVVAMLLQWILIAPLVGKIRWRIDTQFMWRNIKMARAFLGIESMMAIRQRLQIILLSLLAGEVATGLYSIVLQLIRPFTLISASVILPLYPRMAQAAKEDIPRLQKLTEQGMALILLFVMPLMLGFIFVGEEFLLFVYDDQNLVGISSVLIITGVGLFGTAVTRALGFTAMAASYENVNFRVQTINVVLSVILSLLLISQFQLDGAALASSLIEIIAAVQFMFAIQSRLFTLNWLYIMKGPAIIAIGLCVTFILLNMVVENVLAVVVIAGLVYTALLAFVGIQMFGGDEIIRKRFKRLTS